MRYIDELVSNNMNIVTNLSLEDIQGYFRGRYIQYTIIDKLRLDGRVQTAIAKYILNKDFIRATRSIIYNAVKLSRESLDDSIRQGIAKAIYKYYGDTEIISKQKYINDIAILASTITDDIGINILKSDNVIVCMEVDRDLALLINVLNSMGKRVIVCNINLTNEDVIKAMGVINDNFKYEYIDRDEFKREEELSKQVSPEEEYCLSDISIESILLKHSGKTILLCGTDSPGEAELVNKIAMGIKQREILNIYSLGDEPDKKAGISGYVEFYNNMTEKDLKSIIRQSCGIWISKANRADTKASYGISADISRYIIDNNIKYSYAEKVINTMIKCLKDNVYTVIIDNDTYNYMQDRDSYDIAFICYVLNMIKTDVIICSNREDSYKNYIGKRIEIKGKDEWSIHRIDGNIRNIVIDTVAKQAEGEINTILQGNSIYKQGEYVKLHTVRINTTYDEFKLLWNSDGQLRQGFSGDSESVNLPCMFTELIGIPKNYNKQLKELCMDKQIRIYNSNELGKAVKELDSEADRELRSVFIDNGFTKVSYEKLDKCKYNKIGGLNRAIVNNVYAQIEQVLSDNSINEVDGYTRKQVNKLIAYIGLSIPLDLMMLMQNHVYQKGVPKVLVIDNKHTGENIGLAGVILLRLVHLCGFDIAIISASGLNSIEEYLSNEYMQQLVIGECSCNEHLDIGSYNKNGKKRNFLSRILG